MELAVTTTITFIIALYVSACVGAALGFVWASILSLERVRDEHN
jgi:hypothetical protein